MSVVIDKPFTRTRAPQVDVPVVLSPRIRLEPERRPTVEAPVKVQKRSSTRTARALALKCCLFCGVFGVSYVASTLSGHYLVEKSRNLSNEATTRASVAAQAERDVQRRIDVLTSASSIEDWALSHSFRPTDGLGQTSKVVNLVATNQ